MVSNLSFKKEYSSGGTEGPPVEVEAWNCGVKEGISTLGRSGEEV